MRKIKDFEVPFSFEHSERAIGNKLNEVIKVVNALQEQIVKPILVIKFPEYSSQAVFEYIKCYLKEVDESKRIEIVEMLNKLIENKQ